MNANILILAIDPGRKKCGLAVVDVEGAPLFLQTVLTEEFSAIVKKLLAEFDFSHIILGNGTAADDYLKELANVLPENNSLAVEKVDERNTTLLARGLYWQVNPPRGWRRLLPQALLPLPEAVDAYAALALARRWLMRT